MNEENASKSAVGFFVTMLAGSLLSAVIGGGFGALVATISPEFVNGLFGQEAQHGIVRFAFAVGMIWGLFIGVAVSGFACLLAAIFRWPRPRRDAGRASPSPALRL